MTIPGRVAVALAGCLLAASGAVGQTPAKANPAVQALMLSDVHFDPFRDPSKVARLSSAPVSGWDAILSEPDAPTQPQDFAALQSGCNSKGVDSDHALFASALKAAKAEAPTLKFATISGDLLVHQFDCKYNALLNAKGGLKNEGLSAFAEKTASYVISRVGLEFPNAAVYAALGNNDSGCGDYMIDERDRFLAGTSKAVIGGMLGASEAEKKQAQADYESEGFFSVTLPSPIAKTRLLVFDDNFMSNKYATCSKRPSTAGSTADMAWLKRELDAAATRGERVWVMGHIPPGVDVYGTLKKGNACASSVTYLNPVGKESLGEVLAAHGDVIRLAVFGHTHMDEMKVLSPGEGQPAVPMKGVSSISPVNGNMPTFTVAKIDPATGSMDDYTVYVAPNKRGNGTWTKEYSFGETYHQKSFSGAAVTELVAGFRADPQGAAAMSQSYEQYFDAAFPISPLMFGWGQYACGMDHYTEAGYKACACAATPK